MGARVSFCQSLDELPLLTAKIVAEAAYSGDPVAIDIYRECGHWLGRGLSLLIDMLNPELIILGSIFVRSSSLMAPYMNAVIAAETLTDSREACKIVPAALGEHIGDIAALTLAEVMAAAAAAGAKNT
jgi:glucokinase